MSELLRGWTDPQDIEDANILACVEAALKAGYSEKQAEHCEGGGLSCPTCPFAENDGETFRFRCDMCGFPYWHWDTGSIQCPNCRAGRKWQRREEE